MNFRILTRSEKIFAWMGIALGAAVSFTLAPHDAFFLPNFSFYWGGQMAVVAVLFIARPRAAAVAGISVVLTAILLGVGLWTRDRVGSNSDGLVWLIYPVLLLGAAFGGLVAAWWCGSTSGYTGIRIACVTGMAAACGSCLVAVFACNSAFYCH